MAKDREETREAMKETGRKALPEGFSEQKREPEEAAEPLCEDIPELRAVKQPDSDEEQAAAACGTEEKKQTPRRRANSVRRAAGIVIMLAGLGVCAYPVVRQAQSRDFNREAIDMILTPQPEKPAAGGEGNNPSSPGDGEAAGKDGTSGNNGGNAEGSGEGFGGSSGNPGGSSGNPGGSSENPGGSGEGSGGSSENPGGSGEGSGGSSENPGGSGEGSGGSSENPGGNGEGLGGSSGNPGGNGEGLGGSSGNPDGNGEGLGGSSGNPDGNSDNPEEDSQNEDKPNRLNNRTVIGVIQIEAIDLIYAIVEGTETEDIGVAIGHISDTAGLGELGNCALAGHRGGYSGPYFKNVDQLKKGDSVVITKAGGQKFEYRVTESFIVEPTELWVIEDTGDEKAVLTLVTCEDSGDTRLIVRCEMEE